jgi:hypothetical protein
VVKVIDVAAETGGKILTVLLNAELDEALAVLAEPGAAARPSCAPADGVRRQGEPDGYWKWRLQMAERIAVECDLERFGVQGLYVFGSTKNATAGPGSDIDLLVHHRGTDGQRRELLTWLDGWSRCLAEVNFLRTGYRQEGLLDVHVVTDEDIAARTSFAVKIGAITDAARPLETARRGG